MKSFMTHTAERGASFSHSFSSRGDGSDAARFPAPPNAVPFSNAAWRNQFPRSLRKFIQTSAWLIFLLFTQFGYSARVSDYIPDLDTTKSLKDAGMLQETPLPLGGRRLNYCLLETFESSKVTTRAQQTMFGYCTADYHPVLSGGDTLLAFSISYVILDFEGKLDKAGVSWLVTFDAENGTKHAVVKGPSAKKFHAELPGWAKDQLHLLSGFLSAKPGNPPIKYSSTSSEAALSLVGFVMDFAPGVAKSALGELLENILKKFTSTTLTELLASDELHWGRANGITSKPILDNKQTYQNSGSQMWDF